MKHSLLGLGSCAAFEDLGDSKVHMLQCGRVLECSATCRRCKQLTQPPDTITAMGDEEGATKTSNKERRRTKRQRENGSQTDDDTLQDGGATM